MITNTLEDKISRTYGLWGSSAAWATFPTDYALGRVKVAESNGYMVFLFAPDGLGCYELYRWACGSIKA